MGRDTTNSLIAFLALKKVGLSLISHGAWFQMCIASLVNVLSLLDVTFDSFSNQFDSSAQHSKVLAMLAQ